VARSSTAEGRRYGRARGSRESARARYTHRFVFAMSRAARGQRKVDGEHHSARASQVRAKQSHGESSFMVVINMK